MTLAGVIYRHESWVMREIGMKQEDLSGRKTEMTVFIITISADTGIH